MFPPQQTISQETVKSSMNASVSGQQGRGSAPPLLHLCFTASAAEKRWESGILLSVNPILMCWPRVVSSKPAQPYVNVALRSCMTAHNTPLLQSFQRKLRGVGEEAWGGKLLWPDLCSAFSPMLKTFLRIRNFILRGLSYRTRVSRGHVRQGAYACMTGCCVSRREITMWVHVSYLSHIIHHPQQPHSLMRAWRKVHAELVRRKQLSERWTSRHHKQ